MEEGSDPGFSLGYQLWELYFLFQLVQKVISKYVWIKWPQSNDFEIIKCILNWSSFSICNIP